MTFSFSMVCLVSATGVPPLCWLTMVHKWRLASAAAAHAGEQHLHGHGDDCLHDGAHGTWPPGLLGRAWSTDRILSMAAWSSQSGRCPGRAKVEQWVYPAAMSKVSQEAAHRLVTCNERVVAPRPTAVVHAQRGGSPPDLREDVLEE
jgi:hypothetical protein